MGDLMTLVYYVLDATRKYQRVKIGITTNLVERLKMLQKQTTSGQVPIVLALEEGGVDVERQRHRQFDACRLSGEWFAYEQNSAEWIREGTVPEGYDETARVCAELVEWIAGLDNPMAFVMDNEHLWPDAGGWNGLPFTTKTGLVHRRGLSLAAVDDEADDDDVVRVVEF